MDKRTYKKKNVNKKKKDNWIKKHCNRCRFYTERDTYWEFERCYSICIMKGN